LGNESLSKGLGEFVGVGVFSDTTGVVVGLGVGVFSDTTGVVVGLGVALGDADVATIVVSLQPTNSAINNPGIAKFSFMFKIYLYVYSINCNCQAESSGYFTQINPIEKVGFLRPIAKFLLLQALTKNLFCA